RSSSRSSPAKASSSPKTCSRPKAEAEGAMFWILTATTAFLTLVCLYLASTETSRARQRLVVDRMGRVLGAGVSAAVVHSILREDRSDLGNMLSGAAKRYRALRALELMLYRAG